MPLELLVTTDVMPSTAVLLAGLTALSRRADVRRVDIHPAPLRYLVHREVPSTQDPAALAHILAVALGLPVTARDG